MNKLKLKGQTLGRVFNTRSVCMSCHKLTAQYQHDLTSSWKLCPNNF